jgi:hypothetical protein
MVDPQIIITGLIFLLGVYGEVSSVDGAIESRNFNVA